jgi:GGDEF domain-containing protein
MNHFWSKEFKEHQTTKFQRDNYRNKLKVEENERLVDIVTGVPNMKSLEQDLTEFFVEKRKAKELQFILIDLRNFRKINNTYGFMKTNKVLRMVAQNIYLTMRRNEDMYKYPMSDNKKKGFFDKFYRIHSGGDEFAFIIEGDQSDAIGFVNRLVPRFVQEFSSLTKEILEKEEKLSFYSAIVQINQRDEYGDVIERAQDCYNLAKESNADFSLSWYPHTIEENIPDQGWKKKNYSNAREIFEVVLNDL